MRLPRIHNIRQRADFARIKETGQAKVGRFVILSTLEDLNLHHIRPGFITTKRTGKAHERNLLRRRFRAFVQTYTPTFANSHRFLVTIARPGAKDATFAELKADWLRQAKRLGLISKQDHPT